MTFSSDNFSQSRVIGVDNAGWYLSRRFVLSFVGYKFNFCWVSSYSHACIRRFINRDKYLLTFILYIRIKISWVQRTHSLFRGKFWFLVVSNFDQRQNSEVNTCIRGVVSFSKESQSEICAWIVRKEFKSSGNVVALSLSLFCLYRVLRVCVIFSLLCVRVYFVGSFASRQFYKPLTVSERFITGELFGLVNQRTSHSCSFLGKIVLAKMNLFDLISSWQEPTSRTLQLPF